MSNNKGKQFRGGGGEKNGFVNPRIVPSIDEEQRSIYKREANNIIRKFLQSGSKHTTLDIMTRDQRKVMHEVAQSNGLITRSTGKEPNRCIILSLRENRLCRSNRISTDAITPTLNSLSMLKDFVTKNPITEEEMSEFMAEKNSKKQYGKYSSSRNKTGIPPKSNCSAEMQKTKEALPAFNYRSRVLQSIESNDVVIISGGTGCGKTTQVPQFILDDAHENQKHVRIMVTQPRRIAATSIAERVAKERGEQLGGIVGYQIRLESRKSDKTLLTYCTTGVLLRILTSDPLASGITHIIMDEIHEREINTDYLLIELRECIKQRPDLKIILMSATIEGNMQLFEKYFDKQSVDVIRIESRSFDVKIFYLDEILALSGYQPPETKVFFATSNFEPDKWKDEIKELEKDAKMEKIKEEEEMAKMQVSDTTIQFDTTVFDATNCQSNFYDPMQTSQDYNTMVYYPNTSMNPNITNEWQYGPYQTADGSVIDERTMNNFMNFTGAADMRPSLTVEFNPNSTDSVLINGVRYKTDPNQSDGLLTKQKVDRQQMPEYPLIYHFPQFPQIVPVMLPPPAIQRATIPLIPIPPVTGDTPPPPSSGLSGFSTVDFGGFGHKQRLSNLLEKKFREELKTVLPDRTLYYHPNMIKAIEKTDFKKIRFGEKYEMFYGSEFTNSVDLHLLNHVIRYLADSPVFGTILVFLPGFEDINMIMKMIEKWQTNLVNYKHATKIPLHSQIHSINHGDIFKSVNRDTRKIILATNIAEASITIEDVIFVVDTGKVKQFSYNHEAKINILSVNSIAKSNAEQRSGRAGRVTNGYCIRLYQEKTYNEMPETQVAEMKRSAIYEVTLHAKSFAPNSMRIAEFLALAPEPPEEESIAQSITFLEQLGAFYNPSKNVEEGDEQFNTQDVDPELTDLGRLMAKLPLDPQLSRMLLFGLALKCLTPIINLVAVLASRDPYLLAQSDERDKQWCMKYEMAGQDYSDHLMFIRLCSEFCSKSNGAEQNEFCRNNYLNYSTMKMISGTRRQLLQELSRAKLINVQGDIMMALNDPVFNKYSNSWPMVQGAIAAGCYPSIGISSAETLLKKIQTFNDATAGLHPSSILKKQVLKMSKLDKDNPRLEYVAFQEMSQMASDKSLAIKIVTVIPAMAALMFTGAIRMPQDVVNEYGLVYEEGESIEPEIRVFGFGADLRTHNLDEWYSVKANVNNLRLLLRLRHRFMHYLVHGIEESSMFGSGTSETHHKMLDLIRHLLEADLERHKISQVAMPLVNQRSSYNSYGDHKKPYYDFSKKTDYPKREYSDRKNYNTEQPSTSASPPQTFLGYRAPTQVSPNVAPQRGNYRNQSFMSYQSKPPQNNSYRGGYQNGAYDSRQYHHPGQQSHSFSGYSQKQSSGGQRGGGRGRGGGYGGRGGGGMGNYQQQQNQSANWQNQN